MQHIERDNSKFKPENHTFRNKIQYKNRTTEKQYKYQIKSTTTGTPK